MKKFVLTAILALAALPSFAQEDIYVKLQGVWCAETKDGNTYFIFENHTASIFGYDGLAGLVWFCNYTLSPDKIIFHTRRIFGLDSEWEPSWQSATAEDIDNEEYNGKFEADYRFSGNKLILLLEGNPLTLSKID
jgi:hypothetical protein